MIFGELGLDDLDEYQGLTEQMMRSWLQHCGWQKHAHEWIHPANPRIAVSDNGLLGLRSIQVQCRANRMGLQELLRAVNPRWRKGFPSHEALSEHDTWLVKTEWGAECVADISYGGSDDGYMVMIPPCSQSSECEFIPEEYWPNCMFWPCDGNASRVRWPTNAEGEML